MTVLIGGESHGCEVTTDHSRVEMPYAEPRPVDHDHTDPFDVSFGIQIYDSRQYWVKYVKSRDVIIMKIYTVLMWSGMDAAADRTVGLVAAMALSMQLLPDTVWERPATMAEQLEWDWKHRSVPFPGAPPSRHE